jgi:hypothetical protein
MPADSDDKLTRAQASRLSAARRNINANVILMKWLF